MTDARGPDVKRTDRDLAAAHMVQLEATGQVAQQHRKQGWREISAEARLEAHRRAGRPPDMDLHVRVVERTEEPQPDDVVHVEVGQQHVHSGKTPRQCVRERSNARPRIEREHRAIWT